MIPTVKIVFKDRYQVINESDFNPLIHKLYYPPLEFPSVYPSGKPLVSICCDTYNHVDYIEQAIRGFLIQRTNFPFEIIIMDDASTDGTTDILKAYQKKHPKLIKLILQKTNQHKHLVESGCFNGFEPFLNYIFPKAKGEYLALCEGDDYWTDPNKLQKQFEFMERNPITIMTYHNCDALFQDTLCKKEYGATRCFSSQELQLGPCSIATATKMIRNLKSKFDKNANGDILFTSFLGQHGDCQFIPNIQPSVYRIHANGVWSGKLEYQKNILISKIQKQLNMNHSEFFGIIIPTYQRKDGLTPKYLKRALDSVFQQNYNNFHVYVIGDKYEDNAELTQILLPYNPKKYTLINLDYAKERDIYSDNNALLWCSGGTNASNIGIKMARQDSINYICLLDHDDWWERSHLSILNHVIETTGADWVCTLAKISDGRILPDFLQDNCVVNFLPLARGMIKASACYNIRTIPLFFRDVYAEDGTGCPSDADLWERSARYIKENRLISCCIKTVTCNYNDGEYTRGGGR